MANTQNVIEYKVEVHSFSHISRKTILPITREYKAWLIQERPTIQLVKHNINLTCQQTHESSERDRWMCHGEFVISC